MHDLKGLASHSPQFLKYHHQSVQRSLYKLFQYQNVEFTGPGDGNSGRAHTVSLKILFFICLGLPLVRWSPFHPRDLLVAEQTDKQSHLLHRLLDLVSLPLAADLQFLPPSVSCSELSFLKGIFLAVLNNVLTPLAFAKEKVSANPSHLCLRFHGSMVLPLLIFYPNHQSIT